MHRTGTDTLTFVVGGRHGSRSTETVFVNVGAEVVGRGMADTLATAPSGSVMRGLASADSRFGGDGDDHAFGGAGDDVFALGPGRNTMDGGDGLFDVQLISNTVVERPGEGFDTVFLAVDGWTTDAAVDLVRLVGGAAGVLTAANDAVASTIPGGPGDDTCDVRSSADRVVEAAGKGFDTRLVEVQNIWLPDHVEAAYLVDPVEPVGVWPPSTRPLAHDGGATTSPAVPASRACCGPAAARTGCSPAAHSASPSCPPGPRRSGSTASCSPPTARLGVAVVEGFRPGLDRFVQLAWDEVLRVERRGGDTLVISDPGQERSAERTRALAAVLRGVADFDAARDPVLQEDLPLLPPRGGVIIVGGGRGPEIGVDTF